MSAIKEQIGREELARLRKLAAAACLAETYLGDGATHSALRVLREAGAGTAGTDRDEQ